MLASNEESFLIGMSSPEYPVWVWSATEISQTDWKELADYFYKPFEDYKKLRLIAKPETAEKLPVLYTDLSNPYSNQAYVNVGYKPCGRIDEVSLQWG